jgi:N-acyl-D-aspartate/D-glutamate deacylase
MASLLLVGGDVIDGSGSMPRRADVLVRDGLIADLIDRADIATVDSGPGTRSVDDRDVVVRDVSGAVVCPGFVDIHTHSDLTLLSNPLAHSKIRQGVTLELVGNCGLGVTPLSDSADVAGIRQAVSYLDLDPSIDWTWHQTSDYLAAMTAVRPSVNVATLTGHLPLRAGAVGFDDRPATTSEVATMRARLRDSFADGSYGLSTGLVYPPTSYADDAELLALGEEVADHGKVFAWHVRDYADGLIASVEQAITVATRTGCRTQISHLTAVGRRNWGAVARVLDRIDAANTAGAAISVDVYPYLYGNAPLSQLLPGWVQADGSAEMSARLFNSDVRKRVRFEWRDRPTGWEEIIVSRVPPGHSSEAFVGKDIATIAQEQSVDGDEIALDLLAELGSAVMIVAGGRSEDDLRTVLAHPAAVVASDGLSLDPAGATGVGSPHPRSYGCFPRYLHRYVDDSPGALADGIRRCTSAPAAVAGLTDRGLLAVGRPADVVVFRRNELVDRATLTEPQLFPNGIDLVLVNGEVVVDNDVHTQRRPGKILT